MKVERQEKNKQQRRRTDYTAKFTCFLADRIEHVENLPYSISECQRTENYCCSKPPGSHIILCSAARAAPRTDCPLDSPIAAVVFGKPSMKRLMDVSDEVKS
jgi:hypothetical protein